MTDLIVLCKNRYPSVHDLGVLFSKFTLENFDKVILVVRNSFKGGVLAAEFKNKYQDSKFKVLPYSTDDKGMIEAIAMHTFAPVANYFIIDSTIIPKEVISLPCENTVFHTKEGISLYYLKDITLPWDYSKDVWLRYGEGTMVSRKHMGGFDDMINRLEPKGITFNRVYLETVGVV